MKNTLVDLCAVVYMLLACKGFIRTCHSKKINTVSLAITILLRIRPYSFTVLSVVAKKSLLLASSVVIFVFTL